LPDEQGDLRDKYPEDNYSEEMGPNARVWKLYLDRAETEDSRMLGDWKDTVDVLLVFVRAPLTSQPANPPLMLSRLVYSPQ
jgi:hypothetical protein